MGRHTERACYLWDGIRSVPATYGTAHGACLPVIGIEVTLWAGASAIDAMVAGPVSFQNVCD
jgi:hypothetical protein